MPCPVFLIVRFSNLINAAGEEAQLIYEQELIFDNIHPKGVTRVNWNSSLHSPIQDIGGDFQITDG